MNQMKSPSHPIALTIAGSDSGGGAGIQADLNTFAALGVHGISAITCLTAQNPRAVLGIQAATPKLLELQLDALFAELRPAAIKTGMLYSTRLIHVVAERLASEPDLPVVVDPVMVAASGGRLLQPAAIRALRRELLSRATLMTPNVSEAELLLDHSIGDHETLRAACRELHAQYGCAVLAKGGHLDQADQAVDFFYDGQKELMLSAPRIRGVATHGTGCTYSAAIAACLALGHPLATAVAQAKQFITTAIHNSVRIGHHYALHWNAAAKSS